MPWSYCQSLICHVAWPLLLRKCVTPLWLIVTTPMGENGVRPSGAYVTATISNAGVVSYTITMYLNPSADNAIVVNAINMELHQTQLS
jgi:hypothetical protein